jgi:uncharacterized membrane protein YfcA
MLMEYLFIGVFAGILSGLLGVGGGIIVVPTLALLFREHQMFVGNDMQVSVGTSVAVILVNTFMAMWMHHRRNAVSWSLSVKLSPGLMVGAALGSYLAGLFSTHILGIFISVALFLVSVRMLWRAPVESTRQLPGQIKLSVGTCMIGTIAGMLGLGGGVMLIPWMRRYQIDFRTIIGTASACGFPLAITALCGHLWLAGDMPPQPGLTGHVYWPAAIGIILSSMLTIPMATRVSHEVSQHRLQQVFSLVLMAIALRLIWELPVIQHMVK